MWFWIYFWIYTFVIIIIWSFFIIAKIHSLKFKNYQPKIVCITNVITIILAILTLIGYLLIFIYSWSSNSVDIHDTVKKTKIEKNMDNFSDISEKDTNIPDWAGEDYY